MSSPEETGKFPAIKESDDRWALRVLAPAVALQGLVAFVALMSGSRSSLLGLLFLTSGVMAFASWLAVVGGKRHR